MSRALLLGLVGALSACSFAGPLVASPGDYDDYRTFRMAAHQGTRLSRAQRYLEAHPDGRWASEVRTAFETEELAYFERAKGSPEGARDYLASLPRGPHAAAAGAALRGAYERSTEIALEKELREGSTAEARFQTALRARKAVAEAILDAIGALLDPALIGATRADPPRTLRRAMDGDVPSLYGLPARKERDLFFPLPGREERHSRVLTLAVSVEEREGRIGLARVEGADLFVHWLEAESASPRDPTDAKDRADAVAHALEIIASALEARFPAATCSRPPVGALLLSRACRGLRATVQGGEVAGALDSITVAVDP